MWCNSLKFLGTAN